MMDRSKLRPVVRVAICQVEIVPLDRTINVAKLEWAVEEAVARHDADIVLLPELANIGYVRARDREFGETYIDGAEPIPGPTTNALLALAQRHSICIVAGLAEIHPKIPSTIFNSAALIGPDGIIGVHRKVHLPGEEKHYFARGDSIDVFATPFAMVGINICYDTFFPEQQRLQALGGAHMLLCPFSTAKRFDHPETLSHIAAARAIENKLFVVACNRVGSEGDVRFNGRSAAYDPYGAPLARLGEQEEIGLAVLDASLFRSERAYHPIYVDRRPELYAGLALPLLGPSERVGLPVRPATPCGDSSGGRDLQLRAPGSTMNSASRCDT
jgi:predicted amidohydrolase